MLEEICVNRENTVRASVRNMTYLITSCYIEFSSCCIVFTAFLKYSNVNKAEKLSYMILRKGWRYQRGNQEDLKTCFLKSVSENNIYKLHTFLFLLIQMYQNQKWIDAILERYFCKFWKLSTCIISFPAMFLNNSVYFLNYFLICYASITVIFFDNSLLTISRTSATGNGTVTKLY
jgi:hypothetical protein